MSCWGKEELEDMLEDVINELDLSDSIIAVHGSIGTPPAELVRLALAEKDMQIRLLRQGFVSINSDRALKQPKAGSEPWVFVKEN